MNMYMHHFQNVVYMSLSVVCVRVCECVYLYRYINILNKCMYISIFVLFPTIVHA